MALASVTSPERGGTDRLLAGVVAALVDDGIRVAGALRPVPTADDDSQCNCDLWLLPDGPRVRITQDLGAGATACRMDAGALEEAVGLAVARLQTESADLVVVNKFGLSEAEGRGFRTLIVEALQRGVPVLIGLSDTHRAAFDRFAEGMAVDLPPDEAAVLGWCSAVVRANANPTQEA